MTGEDGLSGSTILQDESAWLRQTDPFHIFTQTRSEQPSDKFAEAQVYPPPRNQTTCRQGFQWGPLGRANVIPRESIDA